MSSPSPPSATIEDLFAGLQAKESSRREWATGQFLLWAPAERFALRCPSGKKRGQSVLAYVGKANVNASKWSRLRFEKLTREASSSDFDARTADDVCDGAWVWLGCMNAAARDTGRLPRLLDFRATLERRWGPEGLLDGIIGLRDRVAHLGKPVALAFERAWGLEWDGRIKRDMIFHESSAREFVRAWVLASGCDPLPLPSLDSADILARAVVVNPGFWLDEPDALRAAAVILSNVQEPELPSSKFVLGRAAAVALHFPDRPIEDQHIAGWAAVNSDVANRLAQLVASRIGANLPPAMAVRRQRL